MPNRQVALRQLPPDALEDGVAIPGVGGGMAPADGIGKHGSPCVSLQEGTPVRGGRAYREVMQWSAVTLGQAWGPVG